MLPAKTQPKSGTAPTRKKHLPFIRTHQRDSHIIMRCYFYKTAFEISHRWIIQLLMWEFYLSAPTVKKVLDSNKKALDQMIKDKRRFHCLKEYAPHFSWNPDDFKGLQRKQSKR